MDILKLYNGDYYIYGGYAMNVVAGKKPRPNTNINVATNTPFKLMAHFRKYYPNMKATKVILTNKNAKHDIYRLYKTKNNKNSFMNVKHNKFAKWRKKNQKIFACKSSLKNKELLRNRASYVNNIIYQELGAYRENHLKGLINEYLKSGKKGKKTYNKPIRGTISHLNSVLKRALNIKNKFIKTYNRYKCL